MQAMVLQRAGDGLSLREVATPVPGDGQVLLRVRACGVCRTDLHILDGELDRPKLPLVPGHQAVGEVVALGRGASRFREGGRAGSAWRGRVGGGWVGCAGGGCRFCAGGRENLCPDARFTGYTLDGGFAELAVVAE